MDIEVLRSAIQEAYAVASAHEDNKCNNSTNIPENKDVDASDE